MSHKESENSTEDEVAGEQHTSRRGLLVAGAAAVVGATAVAGAATEAKAASIGPGVWTLVGSELIRVPDVSYVGNAELVRDMVKVIEAVWTEMDATGTGGPIYTALTSNDSNVVNGQLDSLIPGNADKIAPNSIRIITSKQYDAGYIKRDVEEVVYVLPQPQGVANSNGRKGGTIRAMMAAVPFGM